MRLFETGSLWKHGEKVWFGEGWKEFANHYSIKFGHFVVFKYKENSGNFRVHIFDETCTEIEFGSLMNLRRRRKATLSTAGISKGNTDENPMPSKNIPRDFVEKYLEDKAMDVIFRNSEGRTWSVQYLYETFRGKANGKFTGP
ncbi:hypothetical protein FEM48_Zijuj08G0155900 [Ziziphus jujuba var. spinosa]|uniref:TF-B3 domain-containing protein n=1 Tax=Ziziphus jujuba var. spinosa TaxID=714518 RepID=A0A978UZY5_ZIZJJ|nr:hypothetical protein FEM48_Zijuj08G0155900 [Ziziphus jujuba var. spinosa]